MLQLSVTTSCKKDPDTQKTTSAPVLIDGVFFYNYVVTKSGSLSNNIIIQHGFFSPPVSSITGATYADVGTVYANNIKLKKNFISAGSPSYYNDTVCTPFPITYSITGGSGFLTTSFVDNGTNSPAFTNYSVIPDTISKSSALSFTFNNSNISLTKVTINGTDFTSTSNVINISSSQLASIPSNTFATVMVNCLNLNNSNGNGGQTIMLGGKNFLSSVNFNFIKTGVVITP